MKALFTLTLACLLALGHGQGSGDAELSELLEADVNDLCKDRPDSEYFRLTTRGDCRDVVRCDKADISGLIRLATVKCPNGLAFDLDLQTCDWKSNVKNCDQLSRPRKSKPNFATDEPVCPDGQLQCASGECMDKQLFCDKNPDCSDGSDENACSVTEDPNRKAEGRRQFIRRTWQTVPSGLV